MERGKNENITAANRDDHNIEFETAYAFTRHLFDSEEQR